jgi:hypothetical protein
MSKFGETLYEEFRKIDSRIEWEKYEHRDFWNKTCQFSLEIFKVFVSQNGKDFKNEDFFNTLKINAQHNRIWNVPEFGYKNMSPKGKNKFDIFVRTALLELK